MIKEINNFKQIDKLLKKEFPNYHYTENPFNKILIYKDLNKIIGAIIYSEIYERAEIDYVCVVQNERNKHIATKLMDELLKKLKNNKCQTISLEVNENNIPAIKLYEKFGFEKKAVRKKYYGNNDGYLMIKEVK